LALVTFGLHRSAWQGSDHPRLPAIGRIDAAHFSPERWKPTMPNPAFRRATAEDLFWAARRVMSFSNEAIGAIVEEAQFSDPWAAAYLTDVLIGRRDRIGAAWLGGVNPIVHPRLDVAGRLSFGNAAVEAVGAQPPDEYRVQWALFDNASGAVTPIGPLQRASLPQFAMPAEVPAASAYVAANISAADPAHPAWATPARVIFRHLPDGSWQTAALVRLAAR
jgi:hypothetical protein